MGICEQDIYERSKATVLFEAAFRAVCRAHLVARQHAIEHGSPVPPFKLHLPETEAVLTVLPTDMARRNVMTIEIELPMDDTVAVEEAVRRAQEGL